MHAPPEAAPPIVRMTPALPQPAPYRPEPAILALGGDFYDPVAAADFPQTNLRFRNDRWAAAVGPRRADDERLDPPFRPLRAAARQPHRDAGAALSRPPVPRVQSRHRRRPRLPVRAAARRRRPPARSRHQGLGPDAVEPLRRRAADAEGRDARAARHRDARGARRRDLEDLLDDRDRRGARARRRALADPLRGAGAAQPRPHPHRHLPAPRDARRAGQPAQADRLLPAPLLRRRQRRPGRACSITSPAPRPASPPPTSPPASSTACSIRTISTITGESFDYGPWRFTPFWDGAFTAAYFDHAGLYAFGRQPEAIHWDLVQLGRSLTGIAEADALTAALETFPGRFREALRDAIFARLGIVPERSRRGHEAGRLRSRKRSPSRP